MGFLKHATLNFYVFIHKMDSSERLYNKFESFAIERSKFTILFFGLDYGGFNPIEQTSNWK